MEAITVPSPSSFLNSPPMRQNQLPPKSITKPIPKPPSLSIKPNQPPRAKAEGVTKPKQSKSRNGMPSRPSAPLPRPSSWVNGADFLPRLCHMQGKATEVRRGKTIVSTVSQEERYLWGLQERFQMARVRRNYVHDQTYLFPEN